MEIWKDIDGFEDYQISNLGNVYSKKTKKRLVFKTNGVYRNISLRKPGCIVYKYIHRLVATAFVPNPQDKPMVNHKDGDKLNNHASNLEWVTKGENQKHAYDHKLRISSKRQRESVIHRNKVFSSKRVAQYDLLGLIVNTYNSVRDAERNLKIARGNISKCCHGKCKSVAGFKWQYV